VTLRALIWCAVSSEAQAEDDKISLPQQEADGRGLCLKEGWTIIDVLKIPGHSRYYLDLEECAADMRSQGIDSFDKLMTYVRARAFDVFICRDSERFARSQSLHARVVEEIVHTGARIYSFADGWIDKTNFRMFIAMAGYKAASDIDRLIKGRQNAMNDRAQRGLPTSSGVPMSHKLIRDDKGKASHLILDESRKVLWEDLATLLLEGIGWRNIERELYLRFGHVNEYGEQWHQNRMYAMITNPIFWGHTARYHRHALKKHAPVNPWIFEEGHSIPPEVTIYYNTHPAVYTDDIAVRVKAELKRRFNIIKGSASPRTTRWSSGLFICGECGYSMTHISEGEGRTRYIKCMTHWSQSATRSDCSQRKGLREQDAKAYVYGLLSKSIEANAPEVIAGLHTEHDNSQVIEKLQEELERLENQIKRMIRKQSEVSDDLEDIYAEQINVAGTRLKVLKAKLASEEVASMMHWTSHNDRANAFQTIKSSLQVFWELPETTINQLLHRLVQQRRFVIVEGEIIGTTELIERRGKRNRGRTNGNRK
jgi:DNA invertase Pin-like site-specific DNA recombinase/uncharacterized protein (UPF0335 family)